MTQQVTPFLMFQGDAEAAVDLYCSIFADAEIEEIRHYASGGAGAEGSVEFTRFRIGNQRFFAIDSPAEHAFTFTPSLSLFVEFDEPEALARAAAGLAEGGQFLMPLDSYPFAERFAWVGDRFGVSWQLSYKRA